MKYETVLVTIDDALIAKGDYRPVIEPVYWKSNIYDGPKKYEQSLKPFSKPQRHIFAIHWYMSEVCNGGHDQFFSNSTGIVWIDALAGFRAIGASENAKILTEAINRLGGDPSLDQEMRCDQLEACGVAFQDLDDRLFKLDKSEKLPKLIKKYMKTNARDFYFQGKINRPVRPKSESTKD